MVQTRFSSIQALRAVAALLVLLFHLRIVEQKYGAGETVLPGWVAFADGGVDLFFVVSGFVMVTVAGGRYRSPSNAVGFLQRRAWRILPPYWVYTTLVVALMSFAPGMVNTSYEGQSVLASYLLWPQATLPLLTVGWTLVHEGYFYVVMALAIAFVPERQLPWYLSIWAAIVALEPRLLEISTPGRALLLSSMTWEFIAGAFVGLYWRRIPASCGLPILTAGAMGFLAGMALLDWTNAAPGGGIYRVPIFGGTSVLMVTGFVVWESSCRPRIPQWLSVIGDSSYSLYLSHVFVISAFGRLWHASSFNEATWQHATFIATATAACIAAGLASYRWLERPLLSFGERFTRARSMVRHPSAPVRYRLRTRARRLMQ